MDIDRNFAYLCSLDTKKYAVNESKKQIQSSSTLEFHNVQKQSI